jgi:hypothetical protein
MLSALFFLLEICQARSQPQMPRHASLRLAHDTQRGLAWSFARSRVFSISTNKKYLVFCGKFAKRAASRKGHATRRSELQAFQINS